MLYARLPPYPVGVRAGSCVLDPYVCLSWPLSEFAYLTLWLVVDVCEALCRSEMRRGGGSFVGLGLLAGVGFFLADGGVGLCEKRGAVLLAGSLFIIIVSSPPYPGRGLTSPNSSGWVGVDGVGSSGNPAETPCPGVLVGIAARRRSVLGVGDLL